MINYAINFFIGEKVLDKITNQEATITGISYYKGGDTTISGWTIFLDNNLKAQNTAAGNANSSLRASIAFGCAADQDKASEFHTAIFQAQPGEGRGFSDSDLLTLGTLSGVNDMETFAQCVESKKYEGWVNNSYDAFSKEGVTATPTVFLNGKEMSRESISDAASFIAAVDQAAATK